MTRRAKTTKSKAQMPKGKPLSVRELEKWLKIEEFCERYQIAPYVQNSYVLSRFWAWMCRIQVSPDLRIPIPRFLTQRDP